MKEKFLLFSPWSLKSPAAATGPRISSEKRRGWCCRRVPLVQGI